MTSFKKYGKIWLMIENISFLIMEYALFFVFRGDILKESKFIIISLYIFCVIITVIFWLIGAFNDLHGIAFNILCNLYSGIIIGLITGYCSYFNEKKKIINNVYNYYYTLYTTCYTAISAKTFGHINVKLVNEKFSDLMPKITENLESYSSFSVHKKDKYMRIMNPNLNLDNEKISKKEILKTVKLFNAKMATDYLNKTMEIVKEILIELNKKRFEKSFEMYKLINAAIFMKGEVDYEKSKDYK